MTSSLDSLSVTIGELKEGQRAIHSRLDKLSESVEDIRDGMYKLPPSPVCEQRHKDIQEHIQSLENSHTRTATIIGTITAAIAVLVTWVIQKVKFTFGTT